MTIILAVHCTDGAVVGADTVMTTTDLSGQSVGRDQTNKIRLLANPSAIFTHTGE
jgi:hypothetical protein